MLVKASHQGAVVHVMDRAAVHGGCDVGQVDRHAAVQQAGVQQVKVGAVGLDVADGFAQHGLGEFLGFIVDIPHIGGINAEHAETDVEVGIGMLGFDFVARAADALFADFADVFVARLVRFGFFIAGFGQLHHNEFAVTAVLGV